MKNTEELEEKLRYFNSVQLSTKKLNKLGLNDYCIKRLTTEGILIKEGRELYKVQVSVNNKNTRRKRERYLRNCKKNIERNNYNKALDNIIKYYELQKNKNQYEFIHIFTLLLKELFQEKEIINVLNQLLENTDYSCNAKWQLIKNQVLKKDYENALEELNKLIKNNTNMTQKSKLNLLLLLLSIVLENEKINVNISEQRTSFDLNLFTSKLEENQENEALKYLTANIETAPVEIVEMTKLLQITTQGLENIENGKIRFKKTPEQVYEGSPLEIVKKSIQHQDFYIAFKNIVKITNKDAILKLIQSKLQKMYFYAKENENGYKILFELISHKKYEEAKIMLTNKNDKDRIENTTLDLINNYEKLASGNFQYNKHRNIFKKFFEFLNYNDYNMAYKMLIFNLFKPSIS